MQQHRPDADRDRVLGELDQLAKGEHTTQQTLLKRYMLCPDWQKAAALAIHSLLVLHQRVELDTAMSQRGD